MSLRGIDSLRGLADTSKQAAKETFRFYATSGKDERRLVTASLFMGITGGITWYVVALYWDALGFTSEEIGLIGGVGAGVGVVSLLFSGLLADLFGRRLLLLVGLLGNTIALFLYLSEKNLLIFMAASSLNNFSSSLVTPSLAALMASKASPSKLKFFFGLQSFSNQIGVTLASATGIFFPGFMLANYGLDLSQGYWYVFLVAAACTLFPIAFVLMVSETRKPAEHFMLSFDRRMAEMLVVYSAQNALIGFGAALVIPWLPLVLQNGMGATSNELSAMVLASNLVIAIGWFVVPKFAEFKGAVTLISVSQLVSVAFLIGIPYSPILLVAAILFVARGFLMLVPSPVLNAYIMNIVNERIRSTFIAISQLAWTLAYSLAYVVAGYLWANDYSKVESFYYCGAFYVAGTLIFFWYFRKVKEPVDETARSVHDAM